MADSRAGYQGGLYYNPGVIGAASPAWELINTARDVNLPATRSSIDDTSRTTNGYAKQDIQHPD